jgi:preprotein translocase subunit SecB
MSQQPDVQKFTLKPKEYQDILKNVDFVAASLKSLNYRCKFPEKISEVSLKLDKDAKLLDQKEKLVTVIYSFGLIGREKRNELLKIKGEFQLLLTSEKIMSDEFFQIFKVVSLDLIVWPYLRELFSNITIRSNLPPLILPLIKNVPPEPVKP